MSRPSEKTQAKRTGKSETIKLGLLFGAIYFIQGISEPTEGLIAQPVRSLLKSWGRTAGDIAWFSALVSLPWSLKPFYGLITDFVPLFGSRRRSYLIFTAAATVLGLIYLYLVPPSSDAIGAFLLVLLVPTVGVAFADVVADALMIERGQPRGMTGLLQSVQWAAMYGATVATGFFGGYLSHYGRQREGFLVCAGAASLALLLALLCVREPSNASPRMTASRAVRLLWKAMRMPAVWGAAAFLVLWNFNPFSSSVQYVYMTSEMGFSELFHGNTVALAAVAAMLGSAAYGFYCRRISFLWLLHLSIAAGVVSTLAYWGLVGRVSALLITFFTGFTYMTGTMIQLDLAARICPPKVAGTVFASLMALSNLSVTLSTALGGGLYDDWSAAWGSRVAFNLLVALGAMFTSVCWLLVPLLWRYAGAWECDQGR